MAGTSVRMTAKKQMHLSEIRRRLGGITEVEEAAKTETVVNGVLIWTLVYEKFYLRNDSYANAVVVLTEYDREQTACIVASGAGGGAVNLSFGATRHFAKDCLKALEDCGFTVADSDLEKGSFFERVFT